MSARQSLLSQRAIAQPTGNPNRRSQARITVTSRNGLRLRVENMDHLFEDELTKLCDKRVEQLYDEFGRSEVYVFVNRS